MSFNVLIFFSEFRINGTVGDETSVANFDDNQLNIEYLDEDAELIDQHYGSNANIDVNSSMIANDVERLDDTRDSVAAASDCVVENQNWDHDEQADVINQMNQMYV